MRHGITRIDKIEDYRLFDAIIDTRTPAEFAEDHIPGAINCPVLDDQQRIEVGDAVQAALAVRRQKKLAQRMWLKISPIICATASVTIRRTGDH